MNDLHCRHELHVLYVLLLLPMYEATLQVSAVTESVWSVGKFTGPWYILEQWDLGLITVISGL